ncbi:MAG: hypothetical protein IKB08_06310 [Clostridia bacterium]|nr:hypothetical protein [Clostridia bacterium]
MKTISLGVLVRNIPYQTPYKKVQTYLFNRNTFELEQKIEVIGQLGIAEEDFYFWDYDYLPLPDISFAHTQRDFLLTCNIKNAPKILSEYSDDEALEGYFGWSSEHECELSSFWWQHHLSIVKQKTIEWCKDYNIPFEDDMPKIKPIEMTYHPEELK